MITDFGRNSLVTWTAEDLRKEREAEIQMRNYRGLTKEGKFEYGGLYKLGDRAFILQEYDIRKPLFYGFNYPQEKFSICLIEVNPETIGQSTGLKDKNGTESYGGDEISFGSTSPVYLVKWSICNAGFYLESMDEQKEHLVIANLTVGEIIGSIHTTPGLTEQENEEI